MTKEEINAAKSPNGGWTKAQLAAWGVPWPPPRGWRKRLTRKGAPDAPPVCEECGLPIVECNARAVGRQAIESYLRERGYGGPHARRRATEMLPEKGEVR